MPAFAQSIKVEFTFFAVYLIVQLNSKFLHKSIGSENSPIVCVNNKFAEVIHVIANFSPLSIARQWLYSQFTSKRLSLFTTFKFPS